MKLSLVVLSAGKAEGQSIAISLPQFIIGRDPQCQLRPASPLISKRHCAVLKRDEKAFIRDFASTNGTFLNDEPVEGECQLANGDILKVGPLTFRVELEVSVPVNKPTPVPATTPGPVSEDEEIAALLLGGSSEGFSDSNELTENEVPEGTTVMDMPSLPPEEEEGVKAEEATTSGRKKEDAAANQQKASDAAADILRRYQQRRPKIAE